MAKADFNNNLGFDAHFVDERLPKTDKSDKTDKLELSHGQVLASLLVVLFAGRFRSLLGVQSKLSKLAIHGLLGLSPEIRIEDISRGCPVGVRVR